MYLKNIVRDLWTILFRAWYDSKNCPLDYNNQAPIQGFVVAYIVADR